MQIGSRIGTCVVLGTALFGFLGCRAFDPTSAQATQRIPPPPTGSYAIPNGTARNSAEPYYARPAEDAVGSATTSGSPTGASGRSGSWYSTPSSGTATPTSASAAPTLMRDASVQPASFQATVPSTAATRQVDLSQLLPVEVTPPPGVEISEDSAAASPPVAALASSVSMEPAGELSEESAEPRRLLESTTNPLPTETGPIGSGVKLTVPSAPLPSTTPGRVSAGSTTLPRLLTPADLTPAPSTSWRPRVGG